MDFRDRIWAAGWTLRQVARAAHIEEAHFHRVISGQVETSRRTAKAISAATEGLIHWTEFFADAA